MRILIGFIVILSFFSSCASRNDIVYFQQDSLSINTSFQAHAPRLQAGDILAISITADDLRATEPFNQVNIYQSGTMQDKHPFLPTYTVDQNGTIDFPQLGKIKLGGLTRVEALNYLKSEVGKFIKNPGVNLNIRNFRVTILGEVTKPGNYLIDNDRITILEALSLAGDLTINGIRKNILVLREENGMKNEYRIDLTNRNSFNSPVYFLRQNDVVYIEPNGAKIQSSKYTQNTSIFVSIAGLIITIIAVIVK